MMRTSVMAGALALAAGLTFSVSSVAQQAKPTAKAKPTMTVYKSPTCGCCSKWIQHMRDEGFEVTSTDVPDVNPIKKENGVPSDAWSCHTAQVSGYVLEGHVPASAVKKLLTEKPKVVGLAVPGMPVGSPGMEVPSGQVEPYNVVSFDKAGKMTVYEKH